MTDVTPPFSIPDDPADDAAFAQPPVGAPPEPDKEFYDDFYAIDNSAPVDPGLDSSPEDEAAMSGGAARPSPVPMRTRRVAPPPPPPIPAGRGYGCADVITAFFLLATVAVALITVLLLANPNSALNPFPPPTLPSVMVIATDPPTYTPTNTFPPLPASPTPLPSLTFTPTATG